MTSDTELISRLRVLKKSYEEELLTKDEYDEYRLKELDDWSNSEFKNIYIFLICSFQTFIKFCDLYLYIRPRRREIILEKFMG